MSTFEELYRLALSDSPEAADAAIQLLELFPVSKEERELFEQNETTMVRNLLRISCDHTSQMSEARQRANALLRRMGI